MKSLIAALAVWTLIALAGAQDALPPALLAMADAERDFARTATRIGIRDAFLEFFADDSIAFTPGVVSAKARLRSRPSQPFSVQELAWEPRTGDVAASGEIGWLTGPSTFINHAADGKPHHGNYLSIWRRQPDGTWKVFIDVGTNLPQQATFAAGFTRHVMSSRYAGGDAKAAATASLLEADRALNGDLRAKGPADAYRSRLTPSSRLHRDGHLPTIGHAAIVEWLKTNLATMVATATTAEASTAADLGYTYGTYELQAARRQPAPTQQAQAGLQQAESGAYVRIWQRDAAGTWVIAADVTQPTRQ